MEQTRGIDEKRVARWFCLTAAVGLAVSACAQTDESLDTTPVSTAPLADVCSQLATPEVVTNNELQAVTDGAFHIACAALEDISKNSLATVYPVDDLPGASSASTFGYGLQPKTETAGPKASVELTPSSRRLYINLSNGGINGIPNTVVLSGLLADNNPVLSGEPTRQLEAKDFQNAIRSGLITVDSITASSGISRQGFIVSSDFKGNYTYIAEKEGQSLPSPTSVQALDGIQQILSEVRAP